MIACPLPPETTPRPRPETTGGFTLIELVAVMAILSLMLFITVPSLDVFSRQDDLKGTARWVMERVPRLKAKAVEDQKDYLLTVDLDENVLRISPGEIREEGTEVPVLESLSLAREVRVKDVTFAQRGTAASGRPEIRFYKRGYSDPAVIHLMDENSRTFSLVIEPFLNIVALREGLQGF